MGVKAARSWQPLLVWGLLGVMLMTMLGFVWRYGSNVPFWDGWDMVPPLTGNQPVTLEWLWSLHNEHRVPLPRLTALLLYAIMGINFKIGMAFGVLLIAVMAYALILAASRGRGYTSWTDAFFPLLLLNIGHATNYLWAWQIQYFLSVLFVGIALSILAQTPARIPEKKAIVQISLCLIGLSLCGGNGLLAVPPLLAWMAYVIFMPGVAPSISTRQRAWLAWLALVIALLVGAYFIGYEGVPYHPERQTIKETIYTTLQLFTIGLGPGLHLAWPLSGLAIVLLLLAGFWLVMKNILKAEERFRASGLFVLLAGLSLLCAAIGNGRQGLSFAFGNVGPDFVFEIRYYLLIVPIWCAVYLIFSIYGSPRFSLYGRAALCSLAFLLLWPNTQIGWGYGKFLKARLGAFEEDMRAGIPPHILITRYGDMLHVNQDILDDYLPMLRQARVGAFARLKDNPPFEEVIVPAEYRIAERVTFRQDTAFVDDIGYVGFQLPAPRYVHGVTLKFNYLHLAKSAPYRLYVWDVQKMEQNAGYDVWKRENRKMFYQPTGDRMNWASATWLRQNEPVSTTTIWLNDTLQEFRFYPDLMPSTFLLSEIKLLVSPEMD